MGQAQRAGNERRNSSRNNISVIYGDDGRNKGKGQGSARGGTRSRTGNDSRNRVGSSSRNGTRSRTGNGSRNGARRRHTNRDLQGLELWELSQESDTPRLMRLADRELERPERRRPNTVRRNSQTVRQVQSRPRPANAVKRHSAKRRKVFLYRCFTMLVIAVCLVLIFQTAGALYRMKHDGITGNGGGKDQKGKGIVEVMSDRLEKNKLEPPAIIEDYLQINDYSRPGTSLSKVKSIFVHYTANPGTSAQQNRSYFSNLAETHERSASAHFIIGYDGDLIQCIPMEEQAYAVAGRNEDSISIECCYQDENGKFTQETYDTLVHTLAWLTQEYHLSTDDILRHYDCGGKLCPLYYVEHEDAWERLLADVENYEPESAQ